MRLTDFEPAMRVYFEPLRKEILAKVRREGFGWTPCDHYKNCIGWCPYCLEMKNWALGTVETYGEPK